jgi:hypothetical protein
MRILLVLLVLVFACSSPTEPQDGCAELGFVVDPEGELVMVYAEGPVNLVGAQGFVLEPGMCVLVRSLP